MIDLLNILSAASSVAQSLSSFYEFLTKKSKTTNIHKRLIYRELRDNLKRLNHRKKRNVQLKALILSLSNDAVSAALKSNFSMNSLANNKNFVVEESIIIQKRNARYLGWDCTKLIDSIDGKITELKNIATYYKDLDDSSNNVYLKLSNLYFQILLLVLLMNKKNN